MGTATGKGSAMAHRSAKLVRLGRLLRDLARTYDVAVVVANQVADRFAPVSQQGPPSRPSSHHMPSSPPQPPSSSSAAPPSSPNGPSFDHHGHNRTSTPKPSSTPTINLHANANVLTLDHQQRFFTGWGDVPPLTTRTPTSISLTDTNLKTPSLGLSWTNQIACRIALIKEPTGKDLSTSAYILPHHTSLSTQKQQGQRQQTARTPAIWKRYMKVVFAPWVRGAEGMEGNEVEFEITAGGLRALGDGDRGGDGVGTVEQEGEVREDG